MTYVDLADRLSTKLRLTQPPIGLAFLEAPPPGVPRTPEQAPSACTFWRRAAVGLFYAESEDHFRCPIGLLTMGFDLPPHRAAEAEALIKQMCEMQYFKAAEVGVLPRVSKPHRVVLYGPLRDFPREPDVVLFILNPAQAMLLAEMLEQVEWTHPALGTFARPTCAAIPRAMGQREGVLSLACVGARTYAELKEEELVLALPAEILEHLAARFEPILAANEALAEYHRGQKARGGAADA